MSGLQIQVSMEGDGFARIRRGLDLLARTGMNPGPMLMEIGQVVEEHTWQRFKKEESPDGVKWKALNPDYRAWKIKHGGIDKTLQSTGRLRHSITHQMAGTEAVAVGTNVEYASRHQKGKESTGNRSRPGKASAGSHQGTPPRPFLGISKEDVTSTERIVRRYIQKALGTT